MKSNNLSKISSSPLMMTLLFTIVFCIIIIIIIKSSEKFSTKHRTEELQDLGVNSIWYEEELPNNERAIRILISSFKKVSNFLRYLERKHPNDIDVKRLIRRMKKGIKIQESEFEHGTSSYTINKGEILSFCLRNKSDNNQFHDNNTLWFVICHELAHVMSVTEGHNQEFIKNFKFLLRESKNFGIYEPVDYRDNNIKYCGVLVTNNPYF